GWRVASEKLLHQTLRAWSGQAVLARSGRIIPKKCPPRVGRSPKVKRYAHIARERTWPFGELLPHHPLSICVPRLAKYGETHSSWQSPACEALVLSARGTG